MSSLSLKLKEQNPIYIGDVVRVRVIETRPSYVWVIIDAPREVPLVRGNALTDEERQQRDQYFDQLALVGGA